MKSNIKGKIFTPKWILMLNLIINNQDKNSLLNQVKGVYSISDIYAYSDELIKMGLCESEQTSNRSFKLVIKNPKVYQFIELYKDLILSQQDGKIGSK
jgi:hypothetical protein